MEKPDKRKEINVDLTNAQIQILAKLNFAPVEQVRALNKLKIIFYQTRVMCVFYQEEVAPETQLYKTKFIQFKFWANKITGGEAHEQQPYLKPISKQNMQMLASEFGFELPEPSQNALELKRKNEQVAQLESTVGELTKKLLTLEGILKASLSENKGDLSRHLSSLQESEDDAAIKKKSAPAKKPKLNLDGGNLINKNILSAALNEGKNKKQKKSLEKEKAALASASKKNQLAIDLEKEEGADAVSSQQEEENMLTDKDN